MVSFINIPAPERGPSIGEQIGRGFGSGFGGAMQQAASGYLQGKISNMFRQQEQAQYRPVADYFAKNYLNVPDAQLPAVSAFLSSNPNVLGSMMQDMSAGPAISDVARGSIDLSRFGGGDINRPALENIEKSTRRQLYQPESSISEAPSSLGNGKEAPPIKLELSKEAKEGLTGQPGAMQQFMTPGQAVPGYAPYAAGRGGAQQVPGRVPLEDVSDEDFANYLQTIPSAKARQSLINARDKRLDRALKERSIASKERMEKHIIEKDQEKGAALTKADEKYLDEIGNEIKQAKRASSALDTMEEMLNTGDLGWIYNPFSGKARENRAILEESQIPIAAMIRDDVFHGQLTDVKFKKIINDWIASPLATDETNRGRIEGLRRIVQFGLDKEKALESIQNPDGTYPKNIRGRLNKALKEKEKNVKKIIAEGPRKVFVNGAQVDKPPPASAFKEGEGFTDNETKIRYVKKNGQMVAVK